MVYTIFFQKRKTSVTENGTRDHEERLMNRNKNLDIYTINEIFVEKQR
jgi:hypothetical protein